MRKTSFLTKIKKLKKPIVNFVSTNPVLIGGLSLGPIVAISTSLKAGVSLSVAFAIILVPVTILSAFFFGKLSKSLRLIVCSLVSCLMFIPAFWLAQTIFPEVNDKVGVFLPLMVVNPIISVKADELKRNKTRIKPVLDALKTALGFGVVMCFISVIREILGSGTIYGVSLFGMKGNIAFLLPFTGFIIAGLMAAAANKIKMKNTKAKKEAEK